MYMFYMFDFFFCLLGVLLGVAFFTLLERKFMGLMHFRKGPSKVYMMGLSQPITDAVKLLAKEVLKLSFSKLFFMFCGPFLSLFFMIFCWLWFNFFFNVISSEMKALIFFSSMSVVVFSFIFMSWGSNSKYALVGGHRGIAQVISYEVCMFLFILVGVFVSMSMNFKLVELMQQGLYLSLFSVPFFFLWLLLILSESNRTPFDMAEGESEIVSGFNIEYGGGLFALIFVSEYGMIMFLSTITSLFFFGGLYLGMIIVCFFFIWARCSFPRLRYDQLMLMSWKISLPWSLVILMFVML